MGKIHDLNYKSPHSQRIADRIIDKPDAAKKAPKPEPAAVPVERVPKVRKLAPVSNATSNAKPVSNGAARIARWRAKQDPEVRKQQNREAVQRSRAKKKAAGKEKV